MENATYCSNYASQEMNTDQFIESLDASNIMHIRKLAPALGNLCSSSESIAGSPENDLSISWDGSCR
jgi:hypothetical protein